MLDGPPVYVIMFSSKTTDYHWIPGDILALLLIMAQWEEELCGLWPKQSITGDKQL